MPVKRDAGLKITCCWMYIPDFAILKTYCCCVLFYVLSSNHQGTDVGFLWSGENQRPSIGESRFESRRWHVRSQTTSDDYEIQPDFDALQAGRV